MNPCTTLLPFAGINQRNANKLQGILPAMECCLTSRLGAHAQVQLGIDA
jgi:hypothetical protein